MSYTRSTQTTIPVHYSGTVSYGPSEHGGTVSYSGTVYETVNVNVHVDTVNFDASVKRVNSDVNILTGSVVATEAAQVASIKEKANKIGSTILKGFVGTISSEISQQIAELQSQVDSQILHLHELAKRIVDKQNDMQRDYGRLLHRYSKVFSDLDNELQNRIYELDKSAFIFQHDQAAESARSTNNDLITTASITAGEASIAQAQISASRLKKAARIAMGSANAFLMQQKRSDNTIRHSMIDEQKEGRHYAPVCYIETVDSSDQINRAIYQANGIPKLNQEQLTRMFERLNWRMQSASRATDVQNYLMQKAAEEFQDQSPHDKRLHDTMLRLLQANPVKSL